jgi:hypothetical protein
LGSPHGRTKSASALAVDYVAISLLFYRGDAIGAVYHFQDSRAFGSGSY